MSERAEVELLLINPGDPRAVYQDLGEKLAGLEPPVWAGMLASFARQHGVGVEILDAAAHRLSPAATAARVAEARPLLAAIVVYGHHPSASTQNMPAARAICRAIKELRPEQKVLMAGGHVAALPEQTLREEQPDLVAAGEGFYTLTDAVAALKAGGGGELRKVRGAVLREGDGVRANRAAPLLMDLDRLVPGPAWDLLPMTLYRAHNWHCFGGIPREPYAALYTSLGCPFSCSFCCIQAPFRSGERELGLKATRNSYRRWSPETVLEQIETLVSSYGVRNLKLADELFVLTPSHVEGICDGIAERGYQLNVWAYARVDTIRGRLLEKLKRAGVSWLALGIESANQSVRGSMHKSFGKHDVRRVVQEIKDSGINIIGNYIFGLPEDDLRSMQETLELALDLNCEFANFYCAMAYPGSRLYDEAVARGWPLPETWSGYSQLSYETAPIATRHLSAAEVLAFRDRAFQLYFRHPPYLEMIGRRFGAATVEQVAEMCSHTLRRKILDGSTAPGA